MRLGLTKGLLFGFLFGSSLCTCTNLGDSDGDTVILTIFHLMESSFRLPVAMNPR